MSGGRLDGQPIKVLDGLWKKQGWMKVVPMWTEDVTNELRWECVIMADGKLGKGRCVNKRDARIRASASLLEKLGVVTETKKKGEKSTRKGIELSFKVLNFKFHVII